MLLADHPLAVRHLPLPAQELLEMFRVDVYGNVVALDAVAGSVAAFSTDHIFPWSKGGLTRPDNLMALSEVRTYAARAAQSTA